MNDTYFPSEKLIGSIDNTIAPIMQNRQWREQTTSWTHFGNIYTWQLGFLIIFFFNAFM